MTRTLFVAALVTAMTLASSADAAPLYVNDFDSDTTASWTVNDPGLTDILVDFYYDYSLIGVPAAPGGTSTRGLKMTANMSGDVFSGFSVSPTGESFAGDYQVTFDIWQNYAGPLGPGGNGTTQLSLYGIGTAGNVAVWPGSPKESLGFGTTLDGGSASDVRAYSSAEPTSYLSGDPVYQSPGGVINESAAYYSVYAPQSAPAAQLLLFPGQTGSTDVGETSFAWRTVVIDVSGGFATWSIDGLPLARVDLSTVVLGGGNIFFGHSDTNNTSSTDPFDYLLNVTLIDNVRVSSLERPVPEPSTLLLSMLAVGGAAMNRRRARRR